MAYPIFIGGVFLKKYLSLILIVVILFNFIIFDIFEKNRVYAELVITSALSIKLFACILAGMGVYMASTNDYKTLYNKFQESYIGQLSQYASLVRNLIIHRIAIDVKGRYEFIRDFINSLDFDSSSSYQKVTLEKIGTDVPINHQGIIADGYTIPVSDGYVFSVGHNIIKTVATDSGYNIYTRIAGGGYELTAGILNNTNEIVFKEDWTSGNMTVYQMYYKANDGSDRLYEAGGGVSIYSDIPQPDEDIDPAESIDIRVKKSTNVVGLPKTTIGAMVANMVDSLDEIYSFDSDFVERLQDYDIDYTDVISESIALEYVPVRDLDTYPPIPGVSDSPIDIPDIGNPDVPIDPSIPIDPSFPIDDSIPIPDELVLDEPVVDDSNVIGLGLITRLLRFIGNILKLAIVTPINIIKSGIIALYEVISSIPSYLSNIIDYIKDIPSKLTEIVTGVLAIPTWLGNILDKVSSIPTFLEGVYTGVIEGIVAIPESITGTYETFKEWATGTYETFKEWAIGIPDSLVERWENAIEKKEELRVKWFEPTKSIDLSPLQVVTIKEKFPFSLPFDFMNIFNQLNSSPEIPSWEVNILSASFTIDFTQFEQLAVIVRWAIVIIFVISLIKFYSTLFL